MKHHRCRETSPDFPAGVQGPGKLMESMREQAEKFRSRGPSTTTSQPSSIKPGCSRDRDSSGRTLHRKGSDPRKPVRHTASWACRMRSSSPVHGVQLVRHLWTDSSSATQHIAVIGGGRLPLSRRRPSSPVFAIQGHSRFTAGRSCVRRRRMQESCQTLMRSSSFLLDVRSRRSPTVRDSLTGPDPSGNTVHRGDL
jgi:hypothetical protein